LAEEQEASIPPGAVKEPQAPMQQQQRIQPEDNDKKD
jgi:hypothetical protein